MKLQIRLFYFVFSFKSIISLPTIWLSNNQFPYEIPQFPVNSERTFEVLHNIMVENSEILDFYNVQDIDLQIDAFSEEILMDSMPRIEKSTNFNHKSDENRFASKYVDVISDGFHKNVKRGWSLPWNGLF